jgi:uroporphyrinogen III methyltransferase/synthase
VRWDSLAALDGTIACYAGPQALPKMLESLIEHGRSPDEAAAIIIHGTLSSQRTIAGTLQELAARLRERPITEAALLIVGKVVNFREHLRWFDSRALFGRRALVMDSSDEPGDLADLLRAQGADVVSDTNADVDVYRQLLDRKIDLVTFTSASAVLNFAANFGADQASDLLGHTVVATLGAAAADAANRAHIAPAVQLQEGSLGSFAEAIASNFRSS